MWSLLYTCTTFHAMNHLNSELKVKWSRFFLEIYNIVMETVEKHVECSDFLLHIVWLYLLQIKYLFANFFFHIKKYIVTVILLLYKYIYTFESSTYLVCIVSWKVLKSSYNICKSLLVVYLGFREHILNVHI